MGVVGSDVTMECSSSSRNCSGIFWAIYVSSRQMNHVYGDRVEITDDYSSSGCSLMIRNVQMTDARRYSCAISNGRGRDAYLIVLSKLFYYTI